MILCRSCVLALCLAIFGAAVAISDSPGAKTPGGIRLVAEAGPADTDPGAKDRVDQVDERAGNPVREPLLPAERPRGAAAIQQNQLFGAETRPTEIEQTPRDARDRCDPSTWPDGKRPPRIDCGEALKPQELPSSSGRGEPRLTRDELLNELLRSPVEERNPDIISNRLSDRRGDLGDVTLGAIQGTRGLRSPEAPPAQPEAPQGQPTELLLLEEGAGLPSGSLLPLIQPSQ